MHDTDESSDDTSRLLLNHYHCTFFLPLGKLDIEPSAIPHHYGTHDSEAEGQAYQYFTPAARSVLFPVGDSSATLTEWRLDGTEQDEYLLSLGKREYGDIKKQIVIDPLKFQLAQIESVRLYRYFNHTYLLAIRVVPKALKDLKLQHDYLKYRLIDQLSKIAISHFPDLSTDSKTHEYQENLAIHLNSVKPDTQAWLIQFSKKSFSASQATVARQTKRYKESSTSDRQKESMQEAVSIWLATHGIPLFRHTAPDSINASSVSSLDEAELKCYQELQLEAWLRFTRLMRIIYPSFAEQHEEGKISPLNLFINYKESDKPNEIHTEFGSKHSFDVSKDGTQAVSKIVVRLLKFFFSGKESDLEKALGCSSRFHDDRMFVSVAYGLVGENLPTQTLKRLFSYALYVDRHADGWAKNNHYSYAAKWTDEQVQKQSLRLWEDIGVYYGYSDHSNAVLGSGSFYRDIIAPIHIPEVYDRMLIQALFYQSSLRFYDDEISLLTDKALKDTNLAIMREQRKEFIVFTNKHWFHKLTEQMQGKEIFKLQQKALELREHYELIKDELERTDEFLQTEHDTRMSRLANKIGWLGAIFAIIALYYSAIPVLIEYLGEGKSLLKRLQEASLFFQDKASEAEVFSLLVQTPVVFIVLLGLIYLIARHKN